MTEKLYLLPTTPRGNGQTNPGGKRSFEQREHDFYIEASLYLHGRSMEEIAQSVSAWYQEQGLDIKLSVKAIYTDLSEIQKRWINSSLVDFNQAKGRELAKWDELERTYWEAWERSLQAKTTEEFKTIYDEIAFAVDQVIPVKRSNSRRKIEERDGAAVFLQGVASCIDARCKILGLYSPEKFIVDWRVEAKKAGIPDEAAAAQFENMVKEFTNALEKKAEEGGEEQPNMLPE